MTLHKISFTLTSYNYRIPLAVLWPVKSEAFTLHMVLSTGKDAQIYEIGLSTGILKMIFGEEPT